MRNSFYYAISLLTIFPLPSDFYLRSLSRKERAQAIIFYAPVGGIIALVLIAVLMLVGSFPALFTAVLMTALWVIVCGALHLDGVADCCDALFAQHKGADKARQVMKEAQVGAMAVVGIVMVLAIKISALASLVAASSQAFLAIFFSCTLARLVAAVYMIFTPYVSEKGLVSGVSFRSFRPHVLLSFCFVVAILFVSNSFLLAFSLVLFVVGIYYFWRRLWMRIIGGYTGDCVGALIEFVECAVLCTFVVFL